VVVAGNALLFAEHSAPLISPLVVNAIEAFIQDWFND
jgi:hypothetical protein